MIGINIYEDYVEFNMSGTGGMYPYVFGILGALQDNIDLNNIKFKTTSGSSYAVGVFLINKPMKQILNLFSKRMNKYSKKNQLFKFFENLNNFLYMHIFDIVSNISNYEKENILKNINLNHNIYIIDIKTKNKILIEKYSSIENWLDTIVASSSFFSYPDINCKHNSIYNNVIDGDHFIYKKKNNDDDDVMKFYYFNDIRDLFVNITGIYNTHIWLYDKGYNYCQENIIPDLINKFPIKNNYQVKSTNTDFKMDELKIDYINELDKFI
jgi:hypothetical protein